MTDKVVVRRHLACQRDEQESFTSHPVLDHIYRLRGIVSKDQLETGLNHLLPFSQLNNIQDAAERLYHALIHQERILIIGDFDADGATSTAIALQAMRAFGAQYIDYLVPNRFEFGYGLTAELVDYAIAHKKPNLIITVDNGTTSIDGIAHAKANDIDVLVTDHHLAGDLLPSDCIIVNPNQPNDPFPSKNLAGCGVIFYVMLALRSYLREQGYFEKQHIADVNMAQFLDLVALGTVADVVPLDVNNRILVSQGLRRVQNGLGCFGVNALLEIAGRSMFRLTASDLGFVVAPRLNAAGRLQDMSLGIECLLSKSRGEALRLAQELDELNQERRDIEKEMHQQALETLQRNNQTELKIDDQATGICLYHPEWHQGVIGILAGRLKEKHHRPTIVFARGDGDELKGSARSIPGYHIRDALERIHVRHPNVLNRFGGHAMAAGVTLSKQQFELFQQAFFEDASHYLSEDLLTNKLYFDAELSQDDLVIHFADLITTSGPWGMQFPAPLFANRFTISAARVLKEAHLKLRLTWDRYTYEAIWFNTEWAKENPFNLLDKNVYVVYQLDVNEYQGRRTLQLLVEHIQI